MSNPVQPTPSDSAALEEQVKHRQDVMTSMFESLNPWLMEFGSWMFGGLIAFNLVIVAPLLTLNRLEPSMLVAILAFACALPLNVSGLLALKLTKDLNDISIDDVMRKAFLDANITGVEGQIPAPEENPARTKKRTDLGLRFSLRLGWASAALTLLGMIAALWYIAWWIGAIFVIVVLISAYLTMKIVRNLMRPTGGPEQKRN